MNRTLAAIIFAVLLGALASAASAQERPTKPGGDNSFPDYTIVNG